MQLQDVSTVICDERTPSAEDDFSPRREWRGAPLTGTFGGKTAHPGIAKDCPSEHTCGMSPREPVPQGGTICLPDNAYVERSP